MSTSSSGTEALEISACTLEVTSSTTSMPSPVSIAASSVSTFWTTILAAVWKRALAPAFSPAVADLVVATRGLDFGNAIILRATSVLGGSFSVTACAVGLGSGIVLTGREGFGNAIALEAWGLTALRTLLGSSCQRRRLMTYIAEI